MGYSPWGHKELDRAEQLTLSLKGHQRKTLTPLGAPGRGLYNPLVVDDFRLRGIHYLPKIHSFSKS